MASLEYITLVTRTSSFYFSEADNNGLNILDQADFRHQILPWQADVWYYQKWLMADDIVIQAHTRTNPSTAPRLYVCKKQVDVNGLPAVITAINVNTAPYLKGVQTIPGNTYTDPDTGVVTALDTTLWVFNCNNFSSYITPNQIYYLRLDAYNGSTACSYYSEPIYVRADKHPNTQLYQCTYNRNRSGNTNVIVTNWYDNYPTNTTPFTPTFTMRCESYVLPLDPKAVNINYLNQAYQQLQLATQQVPIRTLKIGELSTGIPDYVLQMVTEFLLADNLKISGYSYILSGQSSQNAPADMWKSKRDENTSLLKAATVLTTKHLSQQFIKTKIPPPCTCPSLTGASISTDGTSYYGNFTFNLPFGVTCPFTISGVSSFGFPYSFTINSIADFTSSAGSSYTKKFLIGGLASITYAVRLVSNSTLCASGNLVYTCTGPTVNTVAITPNGSGGYQAVIQYSNCGIDCHTVSWTYQQLTPATSDTGTFSNTVPCPPGPSFIHALSPGGTIVGGTTISYKLTATDCCGGVGTVTRSYNIPCNNPVIVSVTSVKIGSNYFIRTLFSDCGNCHSFRLDVIQGNALNSGANYGHSFFAIPVPCGPYPVTIDTQIFPNLDINTTYPYATDLVLQAFTYPCCGGAGTVHMVNITP